MPGLEHFLTGVFRNPRAGIFDVKSVVVDLSDPDGHGWPTVFECVPEEVLEDVF